MAFLALPRLGLFLLALISFSWSMGAADATVPVSEGLGWKDRKVGRSWDRRRELALRCSTRVSNCQRSDLPINKFAEPQQPFVKYFQVPADMKRSEVLAFLSGLADWVSYVNAAPLSRQEKTDLRARQERATFPQPPPREKSPCKNFFWKTFSSC